MSQIDLSEAKGFVIDLTSKAGEIAKKYQFAADLKHKSKGTSDFATEADIEVEEFLKKNLEKKYPGSEFLMEESAPQDYSGFSSKETLWVIDPIDGTANFSIGNPYFAISVALVSFSKVKLGVVYAPVLNQLFLAREDKKDALLNNSPLSVSQTSSINQAHLATGFPWDMEKRKVIVKWLGQVSPSARQIKVMGSAALDICSVAKGEVDAFFATGIKPWDVAAAYLILEKSGGKITTSQGDSWDIFKESILASSGILHDKILSLIR